MQHGTNQFWGHRLKDTLLGILVGILCLVAGIYLIFWNEKKDFNLESDLTVTQRQVISVPLMTIDYNNTQKIVYLSGEASVQGSLTDSILGIGVQALALKRQVFMYQWKEDMKSDDSPSSTQKPVQIFEYEQLWSDSLIKSTMFKDTVSHPNPPDFAVKPQVLFAKNAVLGAFDLSPEVIDKIPSLAQVDLSSANLAQLKELTGKPVQVVNNEIYVGEDPEKPAIGDLRITLSAVYPMKISVVAQQNGNTLQAYRAPAGDSVLLVDAGEVSVQKMFNEAHQKSPMMTWFLRFVSLVLLIVSMALLLKLLVVWADIMPMAAKVVCFGTDVISFFTGLSLWFIITAIAWINIRPFWALIFFGAAFVSLYSLSKCNKP